MALTFEESEKIEILKQKNRMELLNANHVVMTDEHAMKVERLGLLLGIAKESGKPPKEED